MEFQDYILQKKELYDLLLSYLENNDSDEFEYSNLMKYLNNDKFQTNHEEFKELLQLFNKISKDHHRSAHFFKKINQILQNFKENIKKSFSNIEIFQLFQENLRILLFLIEENIIIIDKPLIDIIYDKKYNFYFYPEIKNFNDTEKTRIETEISTIDSSILENFEEKRKIGENHNYICRLIREDLVADFIAYINKNNISLSNYIIKPSIYETNPFLIGKKITIIEYATFFGSIQIFQFLKINNVDLYPSLWIFAIHSQNAELVHLLENESVLPEDKTYEKCLEESIKCHHNDFANYFQINFIDEEKQNLKTKNDQYFRENILYYCFKYYNYSFFPTDFSNKFIAFYLIDFDYFATFEVLFKAGKFDLDTKVIQKINYFNISINLFINNDIFNIRFLIKQPYFLRQT